MATFFPSDFPDLTQSGRMRLHCTEVVHPENNTSTVTIDIQLMPTNLNSSFRLAGAMTVNGERYVFEDETSIGLCNAGQWNTIWTKEYTIQHNEDGTKAVPIVIQNPSNWSNGLTAWVFYSVSTEGATGYFWAWVPNGTYYLTLTDIEVGSAVKIDDGSEYQEYFIYIDNESAWDKYDAYIDNGTSWDKL